jgi:hypothetical protein
MNNVQKTVVFSYSRKNQSKKLPLEVSPSYYTGYLKMLEEIAFPVRMGHLGKDTYGQLGAHR